MTRALVPVPRAPVLAGAEQERLVRVVAMGGVAGEALRDVPDGVTDSAARAIFRRWVLEAILVLRTTQGPVRSNGLARALGIRAQSFANKARELQDLAFVERIELGGRPSGVAYALTGLGHDVGSLAVALTAFKAMQCEAARTGAPGPSMRVTVGASRRSGAEFPAVLFAASREADALADAYLAARGGPDGEGRAELRRYAETCVRRWHAPVLMALTAGPLRFRELASRTGAGDEALSRALRSLTALGAVRHAGEEYAITRWGWGDVSLGSLLVGRLAVGALHAV